jgi:putative acetyltransferase
MMMIRPASEEDARAILEVHFAAVHGDPQQFYADELLEDWSPEVDDQRVANYLSRPQAGEEFVRVVEMDGAVVAFGVIVPAFSELRACYVHPRVSRQGVGQRLLGELEKAAFDQGVAWLTLNASLNAEPFYLAQGYVADGLGRHPLPGGQEMSCVRMYKFLEGEGTVWTRGRLP